AAAIDLGCADAPIAQNEGGGTILQPVLALAERQLIDLGELEVVRDVVSADRFVQSSIVEVGGGRSRPVAIGIGQQLGVDIRCVEGQAARGALLQPDDSGMVRRVPAMVALPVERVDVRILREWFEGLTYGGAAAPK